MRASWLSRLKKRLGQQYRYYLRDRFDEASMLVGSVAGADDALRLLYIGDKRNREYLRRTLFDAGAQMHRLGRVDKARAHRDWQRYGVDADVVVIATRQDPARFRTLGFFTLPIWLDLEYDMPAAAARLQTSRRGRRDARRIEKLGYDYRITTDPAEFDRFYHEMYLPHVRGRHGLSAMPISLAQMLENLPRSELLQVMCGGEALGGVILVYGKDKVNCWKMGVRGGDLDLVRRDVQSACCVLQLSYLHGKGCERISQGGTRSFIRDGQYIFKKKWDAVLGKPWPQYFCLRVLNLNAASKRLLAENPFLTHDGSGYRAHVFIQDSGSVTVKSLNRMLKQAAVKGSDGVSVYCLDGRSSELPSPTVDYDFLLIDGLPESAHTARALRRY